MELQFLSRTSVSAVDAFSKISHSVIAGQTDISIEGLTPIQIEKIRSTITFVSNQPEADRQPILEAVKCPDADKVVKIINSFLKVLKTSEPIHQLRDFDWSVSLVLGTSQVSNVKEAISTFRFDVNENINGKTVLKSHNIELTLTEAQNLLSQLEAVRTSQRDVLQK